MATAKLTLKQKINELRFKQVQYLDQYETLKILERFTEEEKDDMYMWYKRYCRNYGDTSYQYWLRAVYLASKDNIIDLGRMEIWELPRRGDSDRHKLLLLQYMAKTMNLDITITTHKPLKPAVVSKAKKSRTSKRRDNW